MGYFAGRHRLGLGSSWIEDLDEEDAAVSRRVHLGRHYSGIDLDIAHAFVR